MNILVDTLFCQIETDNPKLISALRDKFSFKVPGAEYSPAYRNHRWDGKKYYVTKSGKFRTGLLKRFCRLFDKAGLEVDLKITSELPPVEKLSYEFDNISLYDYQKECIDRGLREKRLIIDSPTASGKTLIMAGICKALRNEKQVILFHQKQIANQTYEFFKSQGIDCGICTGEGFIYSDIMLCTVQSISRIIDTHLEDSRVLIIDEAHEFSLGETRVTAIESFPSADYRFAFTGTVPTNQIKRFNLEGAFGDVHVTSKVHELVKGEKLAKPTIHLHHMEEGDEDLDLTYAEVYNEYLINNKVRNNKIKEIVADTLHRNKKAKIVVLVDKLDHLEILAKLIPEVLTLQGNDSLEVRYSVIGDFIKGEGKVLLASKILQTGVSIEEITDMINARGMKAEEGTIQALGRLLRKHSSCPEVNFHDFMDKVKYLSKHSKKRRSYYKKQKHKVIEYEKS